MIDSSKSLYRSIEIKLIKQDISFYSDLMPNLASRPSIGVLIFGLIPYLSLFTVETYKYLQSFFPKYTNAISREHKEIISSSRMRVKLFDDTEKRVEGVFELLEWIIDFNKEWHINSHNGLLAPLKRALQDDLGIFFYDAHVIGSTHVGIFNLGYGKNDLPKPSRRLSNVLSASSRSIGVALGEYLGQIYRLPEFTPHNLTSTFSYNLDDKKLKYKDEKAGRFFDMVFNGNNTFDANFSMLIFLANLNFMQYIFKNIESGTPPTLFKLKFITLYHTLSSMEKLKKYSYPLNLLTVRSKAYFDKILEDVDLELIRKQKNFRNVLVHYGIKGIPEVSLNQSAILFGLVEYYFGGRTFDEVNEILDIQIERVSHILEEWLNWKIISSQLSGW